MRIEPRVQVVAHRCRTLGSVEALSSQVTSASESGAGTCHMPSHDVSFSVSVVIDSSSSFCKDTSKTDRPMQAEDSQKQSGSTCLLFVLCGAYLQIDPLSLEVRQKFSKNTHDDGTLRFHTDFVVLGYLGNSLLLGSNCWEEILKSNISICNFNEDNETSGLYFTTIKTVNWWHYSQNSLKHQSDPNVQNRFALRLVCPCWFFSEEEIKDQRTRDCRWPPLFLLHETTQLEKIDLSILR